jgi:hypothetical protein
MLYCGIAPRLHSPTSNPTPRTVSRATRSHPSSRAPNPHSTQRRGHGARSFPLSRPPHTPFVPDAPRSTTGMGRAADLSARTIDSYHLICKYSTTPLTLLVSGFMEFSSPNQRTRRNRYFPRAMSLVESLNTINDLTARSKNIIGGKLALHTRWTVSTTRRDHPSMASHHDHTPLPLELASDYHEVRLDISTLCTVVGWD